MSLALMGLDLGLDCTLMDPPFSPTTKVYHPKFSFDDIGVTSSTTDEFFDTNSFVSNPSFASSKLSLHMDLRRLSTPMWVPQPRRQTVVHITRDFHPTISVSPLPYRIRSHCPRPTPSCTTRVRRQVRPVSLRIKLRSLSSHARVAITLSLGTNTLVLDNQVSHQIPHRQMLIAPQLPSPMSPMELQIRLRRPKLKRTSEAPQPQPPRNVKTLSMISLRQLSRRCTDRKPCRFYSPKSFRFHILSVGRSGVGKSSLINRVFGIDTAHVENHKSGEAYIQHEFASPDNQFFVLHDSKGFEPGDLTNFETVREFIRQRSGPEVPLDERIHGLWLCIKTPTVGVRVFETGDEKLLQIAHKDQVPIVIVFTQYDRLVRTKEAELKEEHPNMDPTRLHDRGLEEAQKVFQDCLGSLKRTMNRLGIPMPRYAKVSVRPGHQEDVSSLVRITRDVVKERVKGDTRVLWAIAQRARLPVKIDACVTKGISYYRRSLMAHRRGMPESGPMLLHDCIRVVHKDIITCWNFKGEVLNSPEFRQLMLCLVQDIHTKPNTILPNVDVISQFVKLATASAPIVPPVAILDLSYTFVEWLSTTLLEEVPPVQRLLIAYVVDLVGVLRRLFYITLRPDLALTTTWKELQVALESYERSHSRQRIHNSIYSNTMRGQQMTVDDVSRMMSELLSE
ncbi:hypothetical protein EDB86DRAFT_3248366 [Lactarius hatsudake]|nr:hypothetical protein EDB86DRAFT_3248366 [Lactarius hatsudake]